MKQPWAILMKPLEWEKQELLTHIQQLEQQLSVLNGLEQYEQITQARTAPRPIHPELEMNRFLFLTQEQKHKKHLFETVQHYVRQLEPIKRQLKIFEHALKQQQKTHQLHIQKQQEQGLDEWALRASHHEHY